MSSKEDKLFKILSKEKLSIAKYMASLQQFPPTLLEVCRKKNAEDSILYRQEGNKLYNSKFHDERIHEKALILYSKSIVFAPNKSEELALGHGNRSALLFHLEKYEDCIKDCNRAIEITISNLLKTKLLCRKAECLALLNKNSAKQVCEEALKNLSELHLSDELKYKFMDKMQNILKNEQITRFIDQTNKAKNSDLYNFKRQKAAPCASTAVKIVYNEKWGRYIVATRDITPGEIIAIEETYYTFLRNDGRYLYCSFCIQPALSSIPCEHCVYDVYCSDKCKSDAWIKYHQFECSVYPHLWDSESDSSTSMYALRFLFCTIYDAGGIKELQNDLLNIEECKDPRTKGFSSEGIFESNKPKSLYSLANFCENTSPEFQNYVVQKAYQCFELLARKTTFFKKKLNSSIEIFKLLSDIDVLFTLALFLRIIYTLPLNVFLFTPTNHEVVYGSCLRAFGSLFNHSCDPNVDSILTKNCKSVTYATKHIKKGSQLFISYLGGDFLKNSKEYRQGILQDNYYFTCNCPPCTENWSSICLPSLKSLLEFTPGLFSKIHPYLGPMKHISKIKTGDMIKYTPELMKEVLTTQEGFSNKLTVYCDIYKICEKMLRSMLQDYFGTCSLDISNKCLLYKLEN